MSTRKSRQDLLLRTSLVKRGGLTRAATHRGRGPRGLLLDVDGLVVDDARRIDVDRV